MRTPPSVEFEELGLGAKDNAIGACHLGLNESKTNGSIDLLARRLTFE